MPFFSSPKEQFAALSSVLSFSVIQIFFNDPNTELTGFIAAVLAFKFYSFFFFRFKPITKHSVALIGYFHYARPTSQWLGLAKVKWTRSFLFKQNLQNWSVHLRSNLNFKYVSEAKWHWKREFWKLNCKFRRPAGIFQKTPEHLTKIPQILR